MKKIFAIFFAVLMVLCFAACNKSDNNNSEGDSNISMSLEEIINAVYEKNPVELRLETTSIDISDADMLKAFTGLDSADKIQEAVVSEPMMGSQAYSFVLIRLKDAADAEDVANAVIEGIDPRKWICVEADDVRVMTKGDVVALYMVGSQSGDEISGDTVEKVFTEVVGGSIDKVIKKESRLVCAVCGGQKPTAFYISLRR